MKTDLTLPIVENLQSKFAELKHWQIFDAIIDAVEKPAIKMDTRVFGEFRQLQGMRGYCVACVATNTICRLSGITFRSDTIRSRFARAEALGTTSEFLTRLEFALDYLRLGDVWGYKMCMKELGKEFDPSVLPKDKWGGYLPDIHNENLHDPETLMPYRQAVEILKGLDL